MSVINTSKLRCRIKCEEREKEKEKLDMGGREADKDGGFTR